MKIAFKGTNKNLVCDPCSFISKKEIYEIGKTYSKPHKENPKLCSIDGYHYCNNIKDVFRFYDKYNGNRFFIIEVTGNYTEDDVKGITTEFTILIEISEYVYNNDFKTINSLKEHYETLFKDKHSKYFEELEHKKLIEEEVQKRLKEEKQKELDILLEIEKKYKENFRLELVKEFLKANPLAIVVGSLALFLRGVRLKRFESYIHDIDIVLPYYSQFEGNEEVKIKDIKDENSGSNFDIQKIVSYGENDIIIEAAIDPKTKWEYIEYDGFKFKVGLLEEIWKYKLKYNRPKDREDLKEICSMAPKLEEIPSKIENEIEIEDLPW